MRRDILFYNGQPKAGAIGFLPGNEGLEKSLHDIGRNAGAIIVYGDLQMFAGCPRNCGDIDAGIRDLVVQQCFDRIVHQVHDRSFELALVSCDYQTGWNIFMNGHLPVDIPGFRQLDTIVDNLIEAYRRLLYGGLFDEIQEAGHASSC